MKRYAEYVEKLELMSSFRALPLYDKKLGNGYKFYYLEHDAGADKTVCFSAGIHGDEEAGPHAVLKFLEGDELPKVNLLIFPVVNPYGFDNGVRGNAQRQDINRRFCEPVLTGEAGMAYRLIRDFGVNYFVSLHEWSGKDGFYMYASEYGKRATMEKIPKLASGWFRVLSNQINGEKVESGVIWHPKEGYADFRSRCTLENRVHEDGIDYVCTETPSQAGLERRTQCQTAIMRFVLENLT